MKELCILLTQNGAQWLLIRTLPHHKTALPVLDVCLLEA